MHDGGDDGHVKEDGGDSGVAAARPPPGSPQSVSRCSSASAGDCELRFPSSYQGPRDHSECSLILSRIAKATPSVRRAAAPEHFGEFRVSTQSRKASSCSFNGSALATGACSKPICRFAPTEKIASPAARNRAKGTAAAGTGAACGRARWKRGWRSGWPRSRWGTAAARWRYPPSADRIEMPAARISSGSARASASTISTSWIIRSSTTSTSRLRGLNRFRRWISKNSGRVARRSSSITAGLKRSRWPTWRMRPWRAGGFDHAGGGFEIGRDGLLHQHVDAGFEQRAGHLGMGGGGDGHDGGIHLAGQFAEIGERLRRRRARPTSAARAASVSTTAHSSRARDSWTTRQWFCPNWPAPTTARRSAWFSGTEP